jgi:hypothetical protein
MHKATSLLFSAFLLPATAHAATHIGTVSSSDLVTLVSGYSGTNPCGGLSFSNRAFFRVWPNGTQGTSPFVIPVDKRLVITDVKWSAYGGPGGTAPLDQGASLVFAIYLKNSVNQNLVYSSAPIALNADNIIGKPGAIDHLTAGIVVGSGAAAICPSAGQSTQNWGAVLYVDQVVLHGYLTQ